ncbi:hypothetical protein N8I77_006292 [Diaporthe amygdali]|uniref:Uncharacterized protein n=1 Tax=Phomopsis amygdali TaxID=1214568 RepID=A0AAD9W4B0_PHOAM|nr:hypothetical protein N8I77_006292 [Diaporthe amygdali]
MAPAPDSITRMLPHDYKESRKIENIRNVWYPLLYQEMSRHWDLIKEGIKGFTRARDEMRSALVNYERDETADSIVHDFLDNTFPGALELIKQIDPYLNQFPSRVAQEAVMICDDDDDIRSVTMDIESGPSNYRHGESSMGPPPRPAAPLTPVTPAGLRDTGNQGDDSSSAVWNHPGSPSPDPAHGRLSLLQTAKRSLDVMEVESPQNPGSPTKKAKSTTGPQATEVTMDIELWEIEGKQYIFKDKRCGPGWFVVRCDPLDQRTQFEEHPLESNMAMKHFNEVACDDHDRTKKYTLDDIIREFTYRVNDDDELTEEKVKSANERLQREKKAQQGSAKKPRKGKERAAPVRFGAANRRQGTADTDESYQNK